MHKIGIISDTHGSTPSDLYEKLSGVDCILHAGDLGSPDVLLDLEVIAPVHAVCGNIDFFELSQKLPRKKIIEIAFVSFSDSDEKFIEATKMITEILPNIPITHSFRYTEDEEEGDYVLF